MRAWTFQDARQKNKLGDKAKWSVGWNDPEGRKRSKVVGSKSMAKKLKQKIEGQLAAGLYQSTDRKKWKDFRKQYEEDVLSKKAVGTKVEACSSFDLFERIAKPTFLDSIKTQTIDRYSSVRLKEDSKRRIGKKVSPATVNKELRQIKAALRKAYKWGCISRVPDVDFIREPVKLIEYVGPNEFQALYEACDTMKRPNGGACEPDEWWQALLTFAFLTGWRVREILALRREDLDLKDRIAITRAEDNKGNRDGQIDLHPVVIEHLERIASFEPLVFKWPHHQRTLWVDFARLKEAAGVKFSGAFHRLRFGFATMNQGKFDLKVLQQMMRHKSDATTRGYLNIDTQVTRTAENLYVPPVLKASAIG